MESQPYNESKPCQHKKKYAVISPSVRMAFIKRVQSKQTTIKEAAKEFGIKFSTSKAILQTYRKEGRVGKKKTRQRKTSYNLEPPQEKQPEVKTPMDIQLSDSFKPTQTINPQLQLLQQQMAQQLQLMQLGLLMHPQALIQQNFYLSLLQQQNIVNQQLFGLPSLQQSSPLVQFGRVEEPKPLSFTPLQTAKSLDQKYDDGRATLKDFI